MSEVKEKEWYENKELFEMIQVLTKNMSALSVDMRETRTLIRDYNGLRKDIMDLKTKVETHIKEDEVEEKIEKINIEKYNSNRKEYWNLKNWQLAVIGTIIGVLGILVAIKW